MKRIVSLITTLCLALVLCLAGCTDNNSSTTTTAKTTLTPGDLENRNYVLTTVNGSEYSSREAAPSLTIGSDLHLSGNICNQFTGKATLDGNVLKARDLASTKRMCADPALNDLENTFNRMITEGATVSFDGSVLVLSRDRDTLRFDRKDVIR